MLREALRDCARRPGWWFWSLAQVAAAAACSAVAISARPGYESSLVLTPVAALAAGMIAAGTVRRAVAVGFSRLALLILAAIAPGLVASLAVLLAAGAVRGLCDPLQGLGFFAVGPLCSALASAALAGVIALALPGRRAALLVPAAVLAASFAWDVALLYYTPQVFVFDHLLGFFGGPVYDEALGLEWRHAVFRLVTAARIAPLVILAATLHDQERSRLDASRLGRSAARAALAAWLLVLAGTFLAEPALALRASQAEIGRRLGGERVTRHLIIHHPAELDDEQVSILEAEAELRWRELEAFFGGAPGHRLSLYFFRSATEMRRLTGTGPTNVAKPWLGAAFMVHTLPPNGVLKHEMAHLFSATWGRGPLRTPGRLMGILADRPSTPRSPCSSSSSSWFTLIEVMVALLIFGIGLLGIMALHVVARKGNNEAQNVSAATVIGEHWMERLRTETTMWQTGASDLAASETPMLAPVAPGIMTPGATTGWIAPPDNPLLNKTLEERTTVSGGSAIPIGEYCTQYRVTTLIPGEVLRAEVRVTWWKENAPRPVNWNTCPTHSGAGGNPDITKSHVIALSSTLWRNPPGS